MALGLAGTASGATVTVVVDGWNPLTGGLVTITTTLTTDGTEDAATEALLELQWIGTDAFAVSPVEYDGNLTSLGGLAPWFQGSGDCPPSSFSSCKLIDMLNSVLEGSVADPGAVTSTLVLHAGCCQFLNLSFGTTNVFGATPQLVFVPEPSTGVLLGLGLGVLAGVRRPLVTRSVADRAGRLPGEALGLDLDRRVVDAEAGSQQLVDL